MAQTYVDLVSKLQEQGISALKQAQQAHLAALSTARDAASEFAAAPVLSADAIPSFSTVVELWGKFAASVLETQKSYVAGLAEIADGFRKDLTPKA